MGMKQLQKGRVEGCQFSQSVSFLVQSTKDHTELSDPFVLAPLPPREKRGAYEIQAQVHSKRSVWCML